MPRPLLVALLLACAACSSTAAPPPADLGATDLSTPDLASADLNLPDLAQADLRQLTCSEALLCLAACPAPWPMSACAAACTASVSSTGKPFLDDALSCILADCLTPVDGGRTCDSLGASACMGCIILSCSAVLTCQLH